MWWFRKNQSFIFPLVMGGLILWAIGIPGCGYTIRHRLKQSFAQAEQGIFVPVFTNYTDEVGVEVVFTNALIRELQSRGEVVIRSKNKSVLELKGEIKGVIYNPTAFTQPGFQGLQSYRRIPSEVVISVFLYLELIETRSKKVLWKKDFSGFRRVSTSVNRTYNYEAPSSLGLLNQSIMESSYSDIARDIMRDVYDDMVELF